jgi:NAD(P)-dependent dehydrogenase (short-subunit alcohol dehydrogenase family)
VTGARRGIGRATAERFAADGWSVALNDVDRAGLEATVAALASAGASVSAHAADVGDPGEVAAMVDHVYQRHGRLDALVNNAGVLRFAPFLDYDLDDLRETVRTNLVGPFVCTQEVARRWVEAGSGGSIVMVSSVSAHQARPRHAAYGSSKAGLEMLTRTAALELAGHGIRVNCVAAGGPILTEMVVSLTDPATVGDRVRASNPMGRAGRPAEVAEAIFHLAGPGASYTTGAVLVVDGGVSLGRAHERHLRSGDGAPGDV